MWLLYPIIVSLLLASLHVSSSGAADTMNIVDLKYNAMSYQLKTVTLRGTVKDLKAFPPHPGKSCTVYGSYAFTLVDESGEVDVEKVGRCFDVQYKPPVNEGDAVVVQGQVQFFHSDDLGAQVPTVRLNAQEVVRIVL
jgi:DNA/RNA endonuclease YhcR with UshA esterase domain